MPELNDYQFSQLTQQTECFIHTHPRQVLDQTSLLELDEADPVVAVSAGATLSTASTVTTSPGGASITVYLPPAIKSRRYTITQLTTGTTVIDADGTDTITGAGTYSLTAQWQSVTLKATNAGSWIRI